MPSRMALIERSSLVAISNPESPELAPRADIISGVGDSGEGIEELLDCIRFEESSDGLNLYGDYRNGDPMALGPYQIWPSLHPDIALDCIMNEPCAREWTRQQILAGHGSWWTSYKNCI